MRAYLLLVGTLLACTPGRGMVDAEWRVAGEEIEVSAAGQAGWCPSSSVILIEATEGDRAVGIRWHFDSLAPGTFLLEPPTTVDSMVTKASAAVRYVHLDEVRGYRSLSGELSVERIDTLSVTGAVDAVLQRVGEPDSTALTMTFDRLPLVADTTLCVAPRAAPDTLAPTPATEP